MPTVAVHKDCLETELAPFKVTDESFEDLCFEFGLELDDITSDYEIAKKERGIEAAAGLSTRVLYKVDVPANRYDLLCLEGLVRALKVFKGRMPPPRYTLEPTEPKPKMQMTVHAATSTIRPYVVCAVLRGISFDDDKYHSFIELQDKLHQNICRKRQLVAIGTHDLSTLEPPFTYEALPPKDIKFKPLNVDEEMDGARLMEHYSAHQQLKQYLPIIRDSPVYPVIYDSKRIVLSLPPIINGDHSKIQLTTKDVFIECTATDLTKANIVLNTMVAMFCGYASKPFTVEPVEVLYAPDYPANTFTKGGDRLVYPNLVPRAMEANVERMKTALSLDLTDETIVSLLGKMCVPCEINNDNRNKLKVDVPVTRSDIMHECDLVEDIAIAYGYNNLEHKIPNTFAGAAEQPVNRLADMLRSELANATFTEAMNWALTSNAENFNFMRRESKPEEIRRTSERPHEYRCSACPVSISNPKTKDFEIVRTSLLPGLLKTAYNAKANPPPIKLFEVGDVVLQEPTTETGSRNVARICAIIASLRSSFSDIHGLVDQIMYKLNCLPEHEVTDPKVKGTRKTYKLVAPDEPDPAFFPGMQASIVLEGNICIGVVGVVHADVLSSKGFDVNMPVTAFEMNIEPFLEML